MQPLEQHFAPFRAETIGHDQRIQTPQGELPLIYADWTASGRLYRPIERTITNGLGPFVGNTHSESSATGMAMTVAYHEAHARIKRHVNAGPDDVVLTPGAGMTAAVNKLQRILGLKAPEGLRRYMTIPAAERPVVFVTHLEHHSNQTSWYETIAEVVVLPPGPDGLVDRRALDEALRQYADRPVKIGAFSACSNVTGVLTPYHDLARAMHRAGGVALIDFAASAPYVKIDMHPAGDPDAALDAVMFSPHKFLGGPGASGVVVFNRRLYHNTVPDEAGGGTVAWTNPWGEYAFLEDIEAREDAGTPGFLQAIKAAMAIGVKEAMTVEAIQARESEIVPLAMDRLRTTPGIHLLAPEARHRLAMLSFYHETLHYNLVVRLLNDRFGVQARGGCSCAGTYGHYLLHVDPTRSKAITDRIDAGDLSEKPGWVRLSFHPTTTDAEIRHTLDAVAEIAEHGATWAADYLYDPHTNEFVHRKWDSGLRGMVQGWYAGVTPAGAVRGA